MVSLLQKLDDLINIFSTLQLTKQSANQEDPVGQTNEIIVIDIPNHRAADENTVFIDTSIDCICGKKLIKINNALTLYNGSVACDLCEREGKENDIFWHCQDGKNEIHEYGYDACNDCTKSCTNYVQHCYHLQRLLTASQKYNEQNTENFEKYIPELIDDYLHIIHNHDDDKDFEFVSSQFGYCDIRDCKMFHNRAAADYGSKNENDINIMHLACTSIMSKIHCYCFHSYDTANRLTIQEKSFIDINENNETILIDKYIIKLNAILTKKREKYHSKCKSTYIRPTDRYH
eukprot:224946_1